MVRNIGLVILGIVLLISSLAKILTDNQLQNLLLFLVGLLAIYVGGRD